MCEQYDLLMKHVLTFGVCVDADKCRMRNFEYVDTISYEIKKGANRLYNISIWQSTIRRGTPLKRNLTQEGVIRDIFV